jgi:hypothetical protein
MLGRAHFERLVAVRFVPADCRRDGDVDVVVAGSETAAVLVLLDARDIREKRNTRDIIELQGRVRGVTSMPAVRLEWRELARDFDVRPEIPPS